MVVQLTRRSRVRAVLAAFLLGLVGAGPTVAGEISGRIIYRGKPIRDGEEVRVRCGSFFSSGTTSPDGFFRVWVEPQGECLLTLYLRGPGRESAPYTVFSGPGKIFYDFEMVEPGGAFFLKRY